jgi:hypothetical protein
MNKNVEEFSIIENRSIKGREASLLAAAANHVLDHNCKTELVCMEGIINVTVTHSESCSFE